MADMDDFLGKVVVDSIKGSRELDLLGTQSKLNTQREINTLQTENISVLKSMIRDLQANERQLKEEISTLKQSQSSGIDTLKYDPFTDTVTSPGQKKFEEGFYQGLQKGTQQVAQEYGSMPFPVEIDFSTNMTVAPVVAGDSRHQGALW